MPWPVAAREGSLAPDVWQQAERSCYRDLLSAVEALVRFGERLKHLPPEGAERVALMSVSAALRAEGLWFGPEKIALYRSMRLAADSEAQVLARASWAVRRLTGHGAGVLDGLRDFLGRTEVAQPLDPDPDTARPVGNELDLLGGDFSDHTNRLSDCDALTRAAYGFAFWRREGITPWDELLEPTVAALILGADGRAPFVPISAGHSFDRHGVTSGAGSAEARLKVFYKAVEAGALAALMELDRLMVWRDRAAGATRDLSGGTPPALIQALLGFPIVSAELVAKDVGCTTMTARRNLNIFTERGLAREVTGQGRYRFWAVAG
ncbi:helix-turn-helix domain-containing protein [Shimia thalassica]|uniref:helix-turn-helix domain-containing protein n=1 Tax=Shimia thalassica TaxID=1715693 RepID=UPI0026E19F8B|nr:helix-turn-helix domain-containing protein [Shimia thalassica]